MGGYGWDGIDAHICGDSDLPAPEGPVCEACGTERGPFVDLDGEVYCTDCNVRLSRLARRRRLELARQRAVAALGEYRAALAGVR